MRSVCVIVNFTRDIVTKCVVDTSGERCENGKHIQGVYSVFPLTFVVKISLWHYFWSHPGMNIDSWDCQNSIYSYSPAGHIITGHVNVITDSRDRNIISKRPKYRFHSKIDFPKCLRKITASLNDFSNRWCKRENAEPGALKNGRLTF